MRIALVVLVPLLSALGCTVLGGESDRVENGRVPGAPAETRTVDVVVLGGGSAGVSAAVTATRLGLDVVLVAELPRLGGMISSGVSETDLGPRAASNGMFEEVRGEIAARYAARGLLEESRDGLVYEPDVAADVIAELVADAGTEVMSGFRLREVDGVLMEGDRVSRVVVEGDEVIELAASVFIDATDTGDLLGQAGAMDVDWVVGRESTDTYGEPHAGEIVVDEGQSRVGGSGRGDRRVQAYNYRMTVEPGGVTDDEVPADYAENLPRYRRLPPGGGSCVIDGRSYQEMWIQACVPGGKMDINVDRVGLNDGYATGSYAEREATARRLRDFALGYLHYLRTERGMPELGLPRDDYEETGHFPPVLYVREARRLVGLSVLTERDVLLPPGSTESRPPRQLDSIAIGAYFCDSHCVSGVEETQRGCEGGFFMPLAPYQVPYGVMVPSRIDGLLVPHAASTSHVAYGTVRMEPVRMSLGQAAAVAASIALERGVSLRQVPVEDVQAELASQGQALLYFADLAGTHVAFEAVQRLAARGALDGYADLRVGADDPLSRAAAAKLSVVALAMPLDTSGGQPFSDVPPDHWAYPFITTLARRGVVSGYGDGTYGPEDVVTRGQLSKLVVLTAGLPLATDGGPHFSDVPVGDPFYPYIETLLHHGIVRGHGDGAFRPAEAATRGQAAIMLDLASR